MKHVTFKGGVHPQHKKKSTRLFKVEDFPAPQRVYLPLKQHLGAPSLPIVSKGDQVVIGQKIAEPNGKVSVPLHASISGEIESVDDEMIIIKNDGQNAVDPEIRGHADVSELAPNYIVDIVKKAGIVGLGGAGFPTHVKITPLENKPVKHVIVNGAECEPYLTSDFRIMMEDPESIIRGCRAIMRALGAEKGYIAIENNKPEALETFSSYLKTEKDIKLISLTSKYPQGGEKGLIKAILDLEVPPGKFPNDIGVTVNNTSTCHAISRAITHGEPLTTRVVTLTGGALGDRRNYRVPIGTRISDLIDAAGGFKEDPARILRGGPMMGVAQSMLEVPVIKTTNSVLALTEKEIHASRETPCIRCGRCVAACPMRLRPYKVTNASRRMNPDKKLDKSLNTSDCIKCGACTYICPAKQNPMESVRKGINI